MHAPLALEAARVYAKIVPAVSHAIHMPTHIFIQHGMWNEVAHQNDRAFAVARELFEPGDSPGDMAHSGDWGQYGFLQLGDYDAARERIRRFEELAAANKNPRLSNVTALTKARYVIESEEWKVENVAEGASDETVFANGVSAARTNDARHRGEDARAARKEGARAVRGRAARTPITRPRQRPPPTGAPDAGKSVRIMHAELARAHRRGARRSQPRHRAAAGGRAHRREHAAAKRRRRSHQALA